MQPVSYTYQPSTNPANHRYGYQGEFAEKDRETGFNHFEYRDYDSRIGRWMVPDPAKQFFSSYLAMGNNPITQTDPTGTVAGGNMPLTSMYGSLPAKYENWDEFYSDWDDYYEQYAGTGGAPTRSMSFGGPGATTPSPPSGFHHNNNYSGLNRFNNDVMYLADIGASFDYLTSFMNANHGIDLREYESYKEKSSLENNLTACRDNPFVTSQGQLCVLFVHFGQMPKGMTKEAFMDALLNKLKENGFSKLLVVKEQELGEKLAAWWFDIPYADLTIRNFSLIGGDKPDCSGYSELNSNVSLVYNGLGTTKAHQDYTWPVWSYVNAATHELGHSIFGFIHDGRGHTNYPKSIMDYRSKPCYNKNVKFHPSQVITISKSIWGINYKKP